MKTQKQLEIYRNKFLKLFQNALHILPNPLTKHKISITKSQLKKDCEKKKRKIKINQIFCDKKKEFKLQLTYPSQIIMMFFKTLQYICKCVYL